MQALNEIIPIEAVDIYQLPQNPVPYLANTELTAGDMHGNAMRFLFMLFQHGIASNLTNEEYAELAAIYQKEPPGNYLLKMNASDMNQINKRGDKLKKIGCQRPVYFMTETGDLYYERAKGFFYPLNIKVNEQFANHQDNQLLTSEKLNIIQNASRERAFLTQEDLNRFRELIQKIKIDIQNPVLIRLIGDLLSDRGSNDYFTLLILKKLKDAHAPVHILASNHDMEFVFNFLSDKLKQPEDKTIAPAQAISMYNMAALLRQGWITQEEVTTLITESYFPDLILFDYGLTEDKKSITIHAHAPFDLNSIQEIAKVLNLPYLDGSAELIALTIEKINSAFQQIAQDQDKTRFKAVVSQFVANKNPCNNLTWKRGYDDLDLKTECQNGDKIYFCHGHDAIEEENQKVNAFPLDNDNALGKNTDDNHHNNGNYHVLQGTGQRRLTIPQEIQILQYLVNAIDDAFPDVKNAAQNLMAHLETIKDTEDPLVLIDVIIKTKAVLNAPAGQAREEAVHALQTQAAALSGSPRRGLQVLGVLMMILGAAAIVAGVLLTIGTLGVATPIGIGIAAAGGAALVSGVGLFAHNRKKGFSEAVSQVAHQVNQVEQDDQATMIKPQQN